MSFSQLKIGALMAVLSASACEPVGSGTQNQRPLAPAPAAERSDALFRRLNGDGGIRTIMTDFVTRAAQDPRINAYFLNSTVLPQRIIECLVIQVTALTGGPFTYPSGGCRSMAEVHRGMNISMADFNDTAGHLVGALNTARVAQTDIEKIVAAVNGTIPEIVEDPGNNRTIYHRVGRKLGIENLVIAFMRDAFADPRISGFFGGTNADRLRTCLTRMVCAATNGPCRYGFEIDGGEPGVSRANVCKDMLSSHKDIKNPRTITKADFDVLVSVLAGVLDRAGVPAVYRNAILGVLAPYCRDIVKDGVGC
jgi:truncated hemoglobin YjbI